MSGDSSRPPEAVTRLLEAWSTGDLRARDELMPMVYAELRRRAAAHLRRERPGHTLRPTDLLHEAYLRLCAQNAGFKNRDHFFGVASRLMRRVLVDHARARSATKRGKALRVTLGEDMAAASPPVNLLELDAALDELVALDEREAQVVELRFRRPHLAGNGPCPGHLGRHGQERLGAREGLAVREAGPRLPPLLISTFDRPAARDRQAPAPRPPWTP